ncbi:protein HOMOLOG OF MAMMALIAN LYST-INTERACTING PROTEIN 5 isoform X2 [Neltuma alba]|uniref:protein HOMOLOG OF MAMMALIAN LYST-INTERACTING PROTEIN 5 isoform X2 n=1 Tax=Neltuma alba TaxID=207710 RepID=UPI0010A3BEA9|nr:protein HOMOLOG OF MAMMALIAN LYST-INTERACTING PROTEIN 5 isoform X2 [Prosopis alba]
MLEAAWQASQQQTKRQTWKNTAKTFYAASIFFEILNQFGALQPDLEQKQKYAAWKAADIRKALKEGRKPMAGPPADDEDLSIPSSIPSGKDDLGTTENTLASPGPQSDASHNYNDPVNYTGLPGVPPAPKFHDTINDQHSSNIPPLQFHDRENSQHSSNISPSSSYHSASYPSQDYPSPPHQDYHPPPPSQDYHPPPPSQDYHPPPLSQDYHHPPPARSESSYSLLYNQQQYSQDHPQHLSSSYPSHETPVSYSYPHFQSYPSFTESSLPSVPSNLNYYQGSSASYSSESAPLTANYSSSAPQNSSSRNGTVLEPTSTSQTYQYDSNYQPPPEKVAEAHKAARFAVGALAFDDVSVAVDYLRKSLELLTKPSAGQ